MPVSAGFIGKFYLFGAAVNAGYVSLALVGVVMSVVSAYYYLRVVVAMYMNDARSEDPWARVAPAATAALGAAVLVVLGFGVFPGPLVSWAAARPVAALIRTATGLSPEHTRTRGGVCPLPIPPSSCPL